MGLYAEIMWRMMFPEGRLGVMKEIRAIADVKEDAWGGVPEYEIVNIGNFDDLPADLCGALLLVAGPDGWEYHNYQRYLELIGSGGS